MKRYIYYIATFTAMLFATSCAEMMNEAREAEVVELIDVAYKINIRELTTSEGDKVAAPADWYQNLEVTFVNFAEQIETKAQVNADGIAQANVIPGIYNIVVRSILPSEEGINYILNGLAQNTPLTKNISVEEAAESTSEVLITPIIKDSPLVFKELFYAGSEGWYFRDQFYEVYNNTNKVIYLDHLCFANLVPEYPTTALPEWPAIDGKDNYAYAVTVWQIKGDGDDYPLAPGESIVFAQEAANHIEISGGTSIVNSTTSVDFECWTGNQQRINAEIPDVPYVFWSGFINKMMWLTTVDGSALALYQPGKNLEFGSDYWQEGVTTSAQVGSNGQQYARIPIENVIDAVECIPSSNDLNMKRIPGILDSGAATVDGFYNGKSVARKIDSYREDGSPIFQDTNNSTADFEVCNDPTIRRYNVKRPAWGGKVSE